MCALCSLTSNQLPSLRVSSCHVCARKVKVSTFPSNKIYGCFNYLGSPVSSCALCRAALAGQADWLGEDNQHWAIPFSPTDDLTSWYLATLLNYMYMYWLLVMLTKERIKAMYSTCLYAFHKYTHTHTRTYMYTHRACINYICTHTTACLYTYVLGKVCLWQWEIHTECWCTHFRMEVLLVQWMVVTSRSILRHRTKDNYTSTQRERE